MRNRAIDHARGTAALTCASVMAIAFMAVPAAAQFELVIGEEHIGPGVVLIFEGAVRDKVVPKQQHLAEEKTHVHIEARANWHEDETMVPDGTPVGGFVAYMNIHAEVMNEATGAYTSVSLLPHVNLIDNLHYARNIALPGTATDPYRVTFFVDPPDSTTLASHRDWMNQYGRSLFEAARFVYEGVDFAEIVNAPPRAAANPAIELAFD